MANDRHSAVYNARIPQMPTSKPRFRRAACPLFIILLLAAHAAAAGNWASADEQLAAKIASVTGPGTAFIDFANRSSLTRAQTDEIRGGLLTELTARGVRFANAEQAVTSVKVTLSEDLQNYVWVAEIHQSSNESAVVMVSLARPETRPVTHEAAAVVIRKTLLWSQPDRILDVAVIDGNPAHMAVLDGNGVNIYKLQDTRWQPEQSLPVSHSRPWPRDLRGRLMLRKDHLFDAFLPGLFCRSTAKPPLALTCYESDDPWPLGTDQLSLNAFFTPARNYFTGALAPGVGKQTTAPPFYSAAPVPREKYTLWLFATVDGQVHLLDGITDQSAGIAERITLNARDAGLSVQLTNGGAADFRLVRIPLSSLDAALALTTLAQNLRLPQPKFASDTSPDLYTAETSLLESKRIIPLLHLKITTAAAATVKNWTTRRDGSWHTQDAWLATEKP